MTTEVEIKNVSENKSPIIVNVWETESPRNVGKNVERHNLLFGQSVMVRIWGWQRGITIIEADTMDSADG